MFEKLSRLLKVQSLKPFGEPGIKRLEELDRFIRASLTMPEACKAECRAQFERFGVATTRDRYRFIVHLFGRGRTCQALCQPQLPRNPRYFRCPDPFMFAVDERKIQS